MPPALTDTCSSDLASAISLRMRLGDVAAGVDDKLADGGVIGGGGLALCHDRCLPFEYF